MGLFLEEKLEGTNLLCKGGKRLKFVSRTQPHEPLFPFDTTIPDFCHSYPHDPGIIRLNIPIVVLSINCQQSAPTSVTIVPITISP